MPDFLNEITIFSASLVLACAVDIALGDPERFPHPVRWMGRSAAALERFLRTSPAVTPARERFFGALLTVVVVGSVYLIAALLLYLSYRWSRVLYFTLSTYLIWVSISIRSLGLEAAAVLKALDTEGINGARQRLSRIVGRDTGGLSREGVLRAASESVAENTSDGIVAPLFYLALGGPALSLAYKAVNTLDSMMGHKNPRYFYFGWFPARLDDAVNYLPARITALFMVPASFILGHDWRRSFRTIMRDGRKHPSPNSGLPEAAVAGALGVRFGGRTSYGGISCMKPFIGDDVTGATPGTVTSSVRIMRTTALFAVILAIVARGAAILLL